MQLSSQNAIGLELESSGVLYKYALYSTFIYHNFLSFFSNWSICTKYFYLLTQYLLVLYVWFEFWYQDIVFFFFTYVQTKKSEKKANCFISSIKFHRSTKSSSTHLIFVIHFYITNQNYTSSPLFSLSKSSILYIFIIPLLLCYLFFFDTLTILFWLCLQKKKNHLAPTVKFFICFKTKINISFLLE